MYLKVLYYNHNRPLVLSPSPPSCRKEHRHDALNRPKASELNRVCDVNLHCVWRNFTIIRKKAVLPEGSDAFQVMRRNCETDCAQRFPQYVVSEWIGHDIRVSAEFYLKVPAELFSKASGTVSELNPSQFAPKSAPKVKDTS